ncbi:hypothetical protein IU501_14570 [Nocardia otitidiscaviarum]|uniref:hypothetical protein n=1 Tax=Nocardia otitidiscaviarum TaxID=1823 RepID=UPI0011DD9DF4|nr:hypothetical protein [Nocardia otitidiscaviarum]MBF6134217.1 hypothetical protein [Nocardia otitidiscaviarum]MBF6484121.1 hypothetical protein [Nocardia otitidiscaviarum]
MVLVAEDGAGNWFALVHLDSNRALLFGCDESTDLYDTGFDPWASAPEWVVAIDRGVDHPRVLSEFVTFARWWDGQRWQGTIARTRYALSADNDRGCEIDRGDRNLR